MVFNHVGMVMIRDINGKQTDRSVVCCEFDSSPILFSRERQTPPSAFLTTLLLFSNYSLFLQTNRHMFGC